jgi:hypothetical protein
MHPWIQWELVADPWGSVEYTFGTTALDCLKVHVHYVKGGIIFMHCFSLMFTVVYTVAFLPCWVLFVFRFCLEISQTFLCSVSAVLAKTLQLLHKHQLLIFSVERLICLEKISFSINHILCYGALLAVKISLSWIEMYSLYIYICVCVCVCSPNICLFYLNNDV